MTMRDFATLEKQIELQNLLALLPDIGIGAGQGQGYRRLAR